MWVLKFHGETLYVNHVDCELPWSTKETPDNPSTKGSIKVKNALLRINENNEATLSELTLLDKFRLRNQKLGITRIIFKPMSDMHQALKAGQFKHSPFKYISGACTTSFIVCDLLDKKQVILAKLAANDWRELKPNETYYQNYDNIKDNHIPVDYGNPSTPYEYS